jgi:hypothetical protein
MKINVKQFLDEVGITEEFYPGKRLVHACKQTGQFKSHCIVLDWRNPEKIRMEVKAGLSGKDLEPKRLKYYPVSFQSPTYVDIEIVNDNREEEEEESKGKSSGSGGGKQPKKNLSDLKSMMSDAFSDVMEGKIPEAGAIKEMVVLGTQIAKESFGAVMGEFAKQIENAKISTTELLSRAGDFVTKYTPPAFMEAKGDEQAIYKYDREKNANIGYKPNL